MTVIGGGKQEMFSLREILKMQAEKAPTKPKREPNFEAGQIIATRSLVIDACGVAWWVDPNDMTICEATAI
jgi:hypothetical protein